MIHDLLMVFGLAGLGACLERIGGMDDFIDRLLTPIPMAFAGCVIVVFDRGIA